MTISDFLARDHEVIQVKIAQIKGSSPREEGAEMFVAAHDMTGTIGGGQLEYMALEQARAMLRSGERAGEMDVPLGPEIGQCCGGRVLLSLTRLEAPERRQIADQIARRERAAPQVLVFGAGHVGRALTRALDPLPIKIKLINNQTKELTQIK